MRSKIVSLFAMLLAVMLVEATILPHFMGPVRVDFFVGLIMGLVIYAPFDIGFIFTVLAAICLQSLAGGRLGYLPFVYALIYLGFDLAKNLFYLENPLTQMVFGFLFNLTAVYVAVLFADVQFAAGGRWPIFVGSGLTGAVCPLMVKMILEVFGDDE